MLISVIGILRLMVDNILITLQVLKRPFVLFVCNHIEQMESASVMEHALLKYLVPDDKYQFITRSEMIEIEDLRSKVSFENFWETRTIHNINLPKNMTEIRKGNLINSLYMPLTHNQDIVKSIVVHARNIRKIHIEMGGTVVWKSHYLSAGLVKITPFDFGIISLISTYSGTTVYVDCDEMYKMYTIGLQLDSVDRRRLFMCSVDGNFNQRSDETPRPFKVDGTSIKLEFDYMFYSTADKKLYTKFNYAHGSCFLT
jgi:hypothetical protein